MSRVEPNRAGIEAMLRSPEIVAALAQLGEKVKTRAEVLTPVDTGLMKASWKVDAGIVGGQARCRVSNAARSDPPDRYPYPIAVEFGYTARNGRRIAGQRVLGRAIDAIRI